MAFKVTQKTVLYAEDDPIYRLTVPQVLGRLGYTVTVVENGKLAVDEALRDGAHYDFILLDNQMPVMGGVEATEEILKKKTVKIILFSADDQQTLQGSINRLGISYLAKPATLDKFQKLLGRL